MQQENTDREFEQIVAQCRDLFARKLHDYGPAWRTLRPESVTDQLYINASRIRSLQMKGKALVPEGIASEFTGIVNYSIVGLIQLERGPVAAADMTADEALALYDKEAQSALELMKRKNHDYDEAWRGMRVSSLADLIYVKIFRTKQIEDLHGHTLVSEGIAANYLDMLNYAVFALIKLTLEHEGDDHDAQAAG